MNEVRHVPELLSHPRLLLPVLIAAVATLLAACGADEESGSGDSAATGIDRAFVEAMVPHHESAVEMAEMAQERGRHPDVKDLADAIVETQNAEIATMKTMAARMDKAGVDKGDLGMEADHMGMDGDMASLETAKPFDREFIDMMIPHHEGALTMNRVLFARGTGSRTRALAQQITSSQTLEIQQMRQFRLQVTGSPAPAPDDGPHDHPH